MSFVIQFLISFDTLYKHEIIRKSKQNNPPNNNNNKTGRKISVVKDNTKQLILKQLLNPQLMRMSKPRCHRGHNKNYKTNNSTQVLGVGVGVGEEWGERQVGGGIDMFSVMYKQCSAVCVGL